MFISFEGLDCTGKTTNIQVFKQVLEDKDIQVMVTREPGGTPFNEELRTLLKTKSHGIEKLTEILLFYAARVESVAKVKNFEGIVLSDRFYDTTFAYQGALGDQDLTDKIQQIHDICLGEFKPDMTLLFDLTIPQYAARKKLTRTESDVFEDRTLRYFERVRNIFLDRYTAEPNRIVYIDASRPLETVSAEIEEIALLVAERYKQC